MIAKIVSHGATRDEARRVLIHGLERTVAFGVTTNQAFLAACLRHPEFAAGGATTAFVGRNRADLFAPRKDACSDAAFAALLLYLTDPFAPPWRRGRMLTATFSLPARVGLDHGIYDLEIVRERDGGYTARLDGAVYRFEMAQPHPERAAVTSALLTGIGALGSMSPGQCAAFIAPDMAEREGWMQRGDRKNRSASGEGSKCWTSFSSW